MKRDEVKKIILPESEIPKQWYNIQADLPTPLDPYYSGQTMKPAVPSDMLAIFPKVLIEQEFTQDRYIDIPEPVREMYKQFRPSPLYRARELEKALGTPARIYYKYEGGNATGSHKLNTAIAQAYYNKEAGIKKIATETGAGQWGSALSMACQHFEMGLEIFMVKCSFEQKPFRKIFMETFGATVHSSPSDLTMSGKKIKEMYPDTQGSLGIAISEAVEVAATHDDTNYSLGSVLNHVCMHQTVIGLEAQKQMEMVDETPDVVIACVGGGSNYAGIVFPFMKDKLLGKSKTRFVGVEPTACPTLTRGEYAFDYGDTAGVAPIVKMYTLGAGYMPQSIHAGGLRYHGMSAIVSKLYNEGYMEAKAYDQLAIFDAAIQFARAEGIVPAPESAHAIRAAIDEALAAKETGEEKVILFNLSGNGYFDMYAYDSYLHGTMKDSTVSDAEIRKSLSGLPDIK
ncbi:MAG: TrpB-like pyridoxal phosphate-dependent enzyme [Saccharofermentanales bacterium]